jgi:hypothetical protein
MAVSFEELEGSPTINLSPQGMTALRLFRVAWDDWPALVQDLIGYYDRVGSTATFTAPLEFPGVENLVVSEIAVEPFDPGNPEGTSVASLTQGTNGYPAAGARVAATYRTLFDSATTARSDMPPVPAGTYLTYDAELSAEFQAVPGRTWHWAASGNPPLAPDQSPALLVPSGAFHLTWLRVPLPPWQAMRDLRGRVNDASFMGAPAGTVIYLGATVERQFPFSPSGGFWRVTYSFAERAIPLAGGATAGWNYQYKESPVSGQHWIAIADDSGNAPYPAVDFAQLFQFGPA